MANYTNRVMLRLAGAAVGVVIYLVRSQMRHDTYDYSSDYAYTPSAFAALPDEVELDKSGELHLSIDLPGFERQYSYPGGVQLFDGRTTISLEESDPRGALEPSEAKDAATDAGYAEITVGAVAGGRHVIHGKAEGGSAMSGWLTKKDCAARSIVMTVFAPTDSDADAIAEKLDNAHCITGTEPTQHWPALADSAEDDESAEEDAKTFPLYGRVSLDVALPHAYAVLRRVGWVDLSSDKALVWMREGVHRTGTAHDDAVALLGEKVDDLVMEGKPKAGRSHFRVRLTDSKGYAHGWIATKVCATRDIATMVIAPTTKDADKLIAPFDKASCTTPETTPPSWPDAPADADTHGPA